MSTDVYQHVERGIVISQGRDGMLYPNTPYWANVNGRIIRRSTFDRLQVAISIWAAVMAARAERELSRAAVAEQADRRSVGYPW